MTSLTDIDYVIAVNAQNLPLLSTYLDALRAIGLQLETREGVWIDKHFVLIKMPDDVMEHHSNVYRVDRLPVGRDRKASRFLSSQRILVLNKILETTRFGDGDGDVGVTTLVRVGTVRTAYPLHNDGRTSLWDHVSGSNFFRPHLPLDEIHAYFGAEVAFYFAYLSFATATLVPVAAIGTLVFAASIVAGWTLDVYTTNEVCDEHGMFVCPICHYEDERCAFRPLSSYCFDATWTQVLDNYWTVVFAMFVSFWATVFVRMWTLKENTLKFRWQVEFPEIEVDARPEYIHRNRQGGRIQPWIPRRLQALHLSTQISLCICLVAVILAGYIGIELYKVLAHIITLDRFTASITGALIQVVFLRLAELVYEKLAILLTDLENVRTQANYNKSALYKRFMLSFANNYGFLFYIAFIKGRLYHTPNEEDVVIFKKDSCQPTTCIVELSISLCLLLLLKRLLWNVARYAYMSIRIYHKTSQITQNILCYLRMERLRAIGDGEEDSPTLPPYEKQYHLKSLKRNFMVTDFCENVIDFGLVTFFVAVTPLAPLLVLLNNYLEIRISAYKLVAMHKRPVPRRTVGIGEWNGVLLGLTYLSTATNAFVMAFTGDSTCRELYASRYGSLEGYVNSTLSKFSTRDSPKFKKFDNYQEVCYYRAQRYPPGHPNKYEHTTVYWENLAYKFIFVFVFEHVIFLSNAILAYLMPKVRRSVKEQKYYNKLTLRRAQMDEIRNVSRIEVQGLVQW